MIMRNPVRLGAIALTVFVSCVWAVACGHEGSLPTSAVPVAPAHEDGITYLANAGVMVRQGDTGFLFDPLFDHSYGLYQLLPDDLRRKLMAGEPPFDDVDVVFITHAHGDHFSADAIARFLTSHPQVKLVAPQQAIDLMVKDGVDMQAFTGRVHAIDRAVGAAVFHDKVSGLKVEAVTVPHSGGAQFADVRNTAYRITLSSGLHVLHLGDATIESQPFADRQKYWDRVGNDLVFTPYWLFKNKARRVIPEQIIRAKTRYGVHVPVDLEKLKFRYGTALDDVDLFTRPGETRKLPEASTR